MKAIQLRPYQTDAINAIQNALKCHQKHIVVEMVTGSEMRVILSATIVFLSQIRSGNILVVTNRKSIKEYLEHSFLDYPQDFPQINKDGISIISEREIPRHLTSDYSQYEFIILYNIDVSDIVYKTLSSCDKSLILFSNLRSNTTQKFFTKNDIVFSYSYNDAVKDGVLTPAMDVLAFEPAVSAFVSDFLKQFGFTQTEFPPIQHNNNWDLIVANSKHKLFVEWKTYKSQVVSASTANSLLGSIVMKKTADDILKEEIVLLIVFSKIPSFQKDVILKDIISLFWISKIWFSIVRVIHTY